MSKKDHLLNVRSVSAELKAALVADCGESVALSTRAAQILCGYFDHPYDSPTGNRGRRATVGGDQLQIRLPDGMAPLLWAAARRWKQTQSQVAIGVLCDHYGLPHTIQARGES